MDYSYGSYDYAFGNIIGGLAIFTIIISIVLLAIEILCIVANWNLFKKAGKGGWEAIIPFYNYWILVEIAGLNWWWFLLVVSDSVVDLLGFDDLSTITNLVSFFASFNCYYNIAKKFNKSTGYSVCAGLFPFIFAMMLGFSKTEFYDNSIPVSKNGCIGTPDSVSNNNYQTSSQSQSFYNNTEKHDLNDNEMKANETVSTVREFSFCGNCGTKLNKDVRFCPNCGKENL